MCGLFGYHTKAGFSDKLSDDQKKARIRLLEGLALSMQVRGKDSSGIAAIKGEDHILCKTAKPASSLIEENKYMETIRMFPDTVIGHTRMATVGDVTWRNAHPFKKGSIIGAHNGSVSNYKDFKYDGVQVDSEVIFELLNEKENEFKDAFKKITGSFALSWMNLKDTTSLFLARESNPLSLIYSKDIKTYFWCSLGEHLLPIARAVLGNRYIEYDLEKNKVFHIKKDNSIISEDVEFKDKTYQYTGYTGGCLNREYTDYWRRDVTDRESDYGYHYNNGVLCLDGNKESSKPIIGFRNKCKHLIKNGTLDDFGCLEFSNKKRKMLKKFFSDQKCLMCGNPLGGDDVVYADRDNDMFYCDSCSDELEEYMGEERLVMIDLIRRPKKSIFV